VRWLDDSLLPTPSPPDAEGEPLDQVLERLLGDAGGAGVLYQRPPEATDSPGAYAPLLKVLQVAFVRSGDQRGAGPEPGCRRSPLSRPRRRVRAARGGDNGRGNPSAASAGAVGHAAPLSLRRRATTAVRRSDPSRGRVAGHVGRRRLYDFSMSFRDTSSLFAQDRLALSGDGAILAAGTIADALGVPGEREP